MKTILPAIAIAIALTATLAPASDKEPKTNPVALEFRLEPGKVFEECLRLEKGQSRRYEWKSDAPADFNIHYHAGKDVHFPVKQDGVATGTGTFTAKSGEDYCWMWTARGALAVKGRIY